MSEDNISKEVPEKPITSRQLAQESWIKKLEAISGKPVELVTFTSAVYLLIDCSSSMAGDKIIQAKDGASGFVKDALLKGYSTGLIRFASFATHILEPLHKEHPIKEGLSKLTAGGSTNMADGIRLATEKLIDWDARDARVICIVTDGEPDDRNATLQFADEAKQRGIDIITIGTNDADQEFLKKIASRTSLAITVDKNLLKSGIISAAKLLPQRKR